MTVRAKFRCDEIISTKDGSLVKLAPVTDGSEENKKFFSYTPLGKIEIGTVNKEAAKQFEAGKEYYVDFTPATVAAPPGPPDPPKGAGRNEVA